MTAAVGFPTLRLVRVAFEYSQRSPKKGKKTAPLQLKLEGLAPGDWRELSPEEQQALQRCF
jgi:23S rRNA pseudouridine2457 synthase